MDQKNLSALLKEQVSTMNAAAQVLKESCDRVDLIFNDLTKEARSVSERESCEALTARFARLCDFLFQKIFRTIDRIELQDEGSALDRLNRMAKRKVIDSVEAWRNLRDLRNEIAHEYLIEKSDAGYFQRGLDRCGCDSRERSLPNSKSSKGRSKRKSSRKSASRC